MPTMDWVPVNRWNEAVPIGSAQQADFALLNPAQFLGSETVGRFEDMDELVVLRIVGYVHIYWRGIVGGFPAQLRIWPGLYDATALTVRTPGDISSDSAANARFWWERVVDPSATYQEACDPFLHPWHQWVDIKPKQKLETMETPVLSIRNSSSEDMEVRARLRMLLKSVK